MDGGRIIGEGEDGCAMSNPGWPCAAGTASTNLNPMDTHYVSKIIKKDDNESEYIQAAYRILGPEQSAKYIIDLKGECSPANSRNPPEEGQEGALQQSRHSLVTWNPNDGACHRIKKDMLSGKNLTSRYKVIYTTRYPITLDDWAKKPTHTLQPIYDAISPFLYILQQLYQNSSEQLINLDLHAGNIFVKKITTTQIQFGLADFGRSLLRQHIGGSNALFFGNYLCDTIAAYQMYSQYYQIPLEVRLLNFCYHKRLYHLSPGDVIEHWLQDRSVLEQARKDDALLYDHQKQMRFLLTKPLFINMIETMQSISRKLSKNPKTPSLVTLSLSNSEKTILEFIITRHNIISPINMIASICTIIGIHPTHLVEFIKRATMAPYIQVGSSLPAAVSSIQRGDIGMVWSDIINGR